MEAQDLSSVLSSIKDDIASIVHNQLILADIHAKLEFNMLNPLEQDYIYQVLAENTTDLVEYKNVRIASQKSLHPLQIIVQR